MKIIVKTAATVVISFLLTLAMDAFVEYLGQSRGSVTVGPMVVVDGQWYQTVDIVNYSRDFLDHVLLSIPPDTNISEIVASSPLEIQVVESAVGIESSKNLQISGIKPSRLTRILIPLDKEEKRVEVINAEQLGIRVEPTINIPNPFFVAVRRAALDAIIYAIILGAFFYWYYSRQDGLENKARALEKRVNEAQEQMTKLKQESREASLRVKVYLLARLSDYTKELDFWRDTVRKMLYHVQNAGKGFTAEQLFDLVTKSLRTYGTKTAANDYETIAFMADCLTESKK